MQDAGYRQIPLLRRDGSIVGWTLVDASDYERLARWTWRLNRGGRAYRGEMRGGRYVTVYLSREVLGLECGGTDDARSGTQVDHVNGDKLDNRRGNLRPTTSGGNGQNITVAWGRSPHRGVHYDRARKKWIATVTLDRRKVFKKRFDTELEAAEAARAKRAEVMPFATD